MSVTVTGVMSLTETVTASDDTLITASAVVDCCTCTVNVASYFCMPGTSTVIRYCPGVTTGNTKNPTSLVVPLETTLVAVLVSVTAAVGTTASL